MDNLYASYSDFDANSVDLIATPDDDYDEVYSGYVPSDSLTYGIIPVNDQQCYLSEEQEVDIDEDDENKTKAKSKSKDENKEGFAIYGGFSASDMVIMVIVVLLIVAIVGYYFMGNNKTKIVTLGMGNAGNAGNVGDVVDAGNTGNTGDAVDAGDAGNQ